MPLEGLQPIRYAEACVAAMREAVGDEHRHHGRLPRPPQPAHGDALRQGAGAVRPLLVRGALLARDAWTTSPLIQRAVKTPIATGERLVGVHAFRELLEKRALPA